VEAHKQFGDDIAFIGVAGQDEPGEINGFIDNFGVGDFVHVNDQGSHLWQLFGISAQPTYVLVDDTGTMSMQRAGFTPEEFNQLLQDMVDS